jgi:DNA-binding transcriptional ArsR family regulator
MSGATDLDQTLAALADPTRRQVIALLSDKPRRSSELAASLSISRPAMSRHLRVLRQAGLVAEDTQADDARTRVYELRRPGFAQLRGWLDEVEAFWADQLLAFKAHAERKRRKERR